MTKSILSLVSVRHRVFSGNQAVAIQRAFLLTMVAVFAFSHASVARAHDMNDMPGMDMSHDSGGNSPDSMGEMTMHDSHLGHDNMKNMALHMMWTDPEPATPADRAKADEMVATLRKALERYKDYRVAEADGFKPFHPEFKQQAIVHFTKWSYALKAQFTFNPSEPTSLLYKRTSDGGYELIGAMYTAPKRWDEQQLNARVPLGIARWHKHINICAPKKGTDPSTVDWTRFGPNGSIATADACDAAGGRFYPTLFGWMVHVYPWETNQQQVWAH